MKKRLNCSAVRGPKAFGINYILSKPTKKNAGNINGIAKRDLEKAV